MPITVRFDPSVNSVQAQIISDATPTSDGVMSAAQAAKLARLTPGGGGTTFLRLISQPADGDSFTVLIPISLQPLTTSYQPLFTIGTPNIFTGISVDFMTQTTEQFDVTTDGVLPDGTVLLCTIEVLG